MSGTSGHGGGEGDGRLVRTRLAGRTATLGPMAGRPTPSSLPIRFARRIAPASGRPRRASLFGDFADRWPGPMAIGRRKGGGMPTWRRAGGRGRVGRGMGGGREERERGNGGGGRQKKGAGRRSGRGERVTSGMVGAGWAGWGTGATARRGGSPRDKSRALCMICMALWCGLLISSSQINEKMYRSLTYRSVWRIGFRLLLRRYPGGARARCR